MNRKRPLIFQRTWALTIAVFILSIGLISCGEDDLFIDCPFDEAITKTCQSQEKDNESDNLTCIVEKHPQCPYDVCIKWRAGESQCTKPCVPESSDCPSDSTCTEFNKSEDQYYCVPNEYLN